MAKEGQTHVIPETLYLPAANGPRGWNGCNLRTTFQKIVARAGLDPWPRLFHNLRASCESDLAREYPIATVCKWIGNTAAIAARHYVQVTDADFERACCRTSEAAQKRAHPASVQARKGSLKKGEGPVIPEEYEPLPTRTTPQVGGARLELHAVNRCGAMGLEKSGPAGGAKSGAVGADSGPIDPDLRGIIGAWPRLSEAVREAVVEMVKAGIREPE